MVRVSRNQAFFESDYIIYFQVTSNRDALKYIEIGCERMNE